MGLISLAAFSKPLAAGAVMLACLCDAPPEDIDAELRKAAQHFADLEDDKAKTILDELAKYNVVEAKELLGYLYADLLYPGRDYEKAVITFEEAAAGGSEEAQFQIAESRFWPDYSNLTLTVQEEAIRPSAEEAYYLIQPLAARGSSFKGHKAARWRLAYLCTFGGYNCGEPATTKAIETGKRIAFDNLRTINGAFHILGSLRSGDAAKDGSMKAFEPYLSLGYAEADPFVADAATAFVWRDVVSVNDCPPADDFVARGRFLAVQNGVATRYEGRLDIEDCYSAKKRKVLEDDVVATLNLLGRGFDNDKRSWHLRRCFQEQEAPSFGTCLIHAVQHHFFSCTKLSLPAYFKRFDIEYRTSKRYDRCREMMLGYPVLYNRI